MTELKIEQLGRKGDGVASENGREVYVPLSLAGETITVSGSGPRRELASIKTPSPDRIDPICKHFGTCGGCQLQHMGEQAYVSWKVQLLTEQLAKAGIETTPEAMLTFPDAARRKCVFNIVRGVSSMKLGFAAKASNEIIPVENCPVIVPEINQQLDALRDIAASIPSGKPAMRMAVLVTRNGLDIAVEDAKSLSEDQRQVLIKKTIQLKFARLTINDETLVETAKPEIDVADTIVIPPPGSFVQASKAAEDAMSALVTDHLSGCKTVADLYCGIGTFALKLARKSTVLAVEESAAAITSLDQAWRGTGGKLKQIKAEVRNLERRPLGFAELKKTDGLIFDPPRAGAELQVKQIAKSKVMKIAAVSCNPVTLARDLAILVEGGYKVIRIVPVDQFKYTPHLEVVALLER